MRLVLLDPIKTVEQHKQMSVYASPRTKNEHKLTLPAIADGRGPGITRGAKMNLNDQHAEMDQLAPFVSVPLGIPVLSSIEHFRIPVKHLPPRRRNVSRVFETAN